MVKCKLIRFCNCTCSEWQSGLLKPGWSNSDTYRCSFTRFGFISRLKQKFYQLTYTLQLYMYCLGAVMDFELLVGNCDWTGQTLETKVCWWSQYMCHLCSGPRPSFPCIRHEEIPAVNVYEFLVECERFNMNRLMICWEVTAASKYIWENKKV